MSVVSAPKLILILVLALHFSASAILEAQTLKVPYVSLSPTAGPLWIAYEAGYFKKITSAPSYFTSPADQRLFRRSSRVTSNWPTWRLRQP